MGAACAAGCLTKGAAFTASFVASRWLLGYNGGKSGAPPRSCEVIFLRKEILLTIRGAPQEEPEGIELITRGWFCQEEDNIRLEYDESELSGMEGTKTQLRFDGSQVYLERTGDTQSCLIFCKRQQTQSTYQMGPFTLPVSVFSTILEYELTPQKGWMELQYTLDLGGSRINNRLTLEYREAAPPC